MGKRFSNLLVFNILDSLEFFLDISFFIHFIGDILFTFVHVKKLIINIFTSTVIIDIITTSKFISTLFIFTILPISKFPINKVIYLELIIPIKTPIGIDTKEIAKSSTNIILNTLNIFAPKALIIPYSEIL